LKFVCFADKYHSMITPDGREIVFAGAGILWGATTFFRGLRIWLDGQKSPTDPSCSAGTSFSGKLTLPSSLVTGFVLILGCTAYLAWSLLVSLH
jgi:hypothetical protein